MSSTDFDESSKPVLASSFSLSEAEIEPQNEKTKLKFSKKASLVSQKSDNGKLPSTTEEESGSTLKTSEHGPGFSR